MGGMRTEPRAGVRRDADGFSLALTNDELRPLSDAYRDDPDPIGRAFEHAFAHVRADILGSPQPDPNPFCEYCPA